MTKFKNRIYTKLKFKIWYRENEQEREVEAAYGIVEIAPLLML